MKVLAPGKFRTKLELTAEIVEWCVKLFQNCFGTGLRSVVMVVADGAYAKRPFLKRVMATGAVVVSRLRKDAALFDLPVTAKRCGKGRLRKYDENRISLAHRGGHR